MRTLGRSRLRRRGRRRADRARALDADEAAVLGRGRARALAPRSRAAAPDPRLSRHPPEAPQPTRSRRSRGRSSASRSRSRPPTRSGGALSRWRTTRRRTGSGALPRGERRRAPTCRRCAAAGCRSARPSTCPISRAHFASGRLDPKRWRKLDDEALIAQLVDVKGIGRWTAEMFLMFHELRPDVLPVDDIGLQKAMCRHYRRKRAPTRDAMLARRRALAAVALGRDLVPVAQPRSDPGRVLAARTRVAAGIVAALRTMAGWTMLRRHLTRGSRPTACSTRSTASDSSATAGCSRSTATRIASTRVARRSRQASAETPHRSSPSSTVPARWSDAQILEEHAFVAELAAREIPVVAPLAIGGDDPASRSPAFASRSIRNAAAARPSSRIARRSNGSAASSAASTRVGATAPFRVRPALDVASFGDEPRDWLLAHDFIPADLVAAWRSVAAQALDGVRALLRARRRGPQHAPARRLPRRQRAVATGGPMHGPHFVDFDDAARARGAGPVDAAVGRSRRHATPAAAPCWPATRTSATSTTASCI